MSKPWDDTMKRLIRLNPQHFVSWILHGARYRGSVSIELKNWTRETDFLLDAILHDKEILLQIEFQSTDDADMAQRLLEYNILAAREHKRHVLSCVIYLRKDSNIAESPLVWELPNGQEVLRFHFVVIKLWEIPAEEILRMGLVGLLPLLPLTKDGAQREVVEQMVAGIVAAEQFELLPQAKMIASLVFKDGADRAWLERSFTVYKDILEDSWVYQENLQKGKVEALHQALLKIVQRRFPEMIEVTKKQIDGIEDPALLESLLINISLAENIQEALHALIEVGKDGQKN